MRSSLHRFFFAHALACALLCTPFALRAQEGTRTRPRRVNTPAPEVQTQEQTISEVEPPAARLEAEPSIRIGLSTNARSVTVSTTGRLRVEGAETNQPELARVRVEPRVMPPLDAPPPDTSTEEDSTDVAAERSSAQPSVVNTSKESKTAPKGEIKTARPAPSKTSTTGGGVRLASRTNVVARGAVLYEPGTTKPLADVRAPVLFASEDEALHPVRFNEKPYRGRLEVFANTRGTLTVVNVVPLEEYVRGVVPNELSPGGFPAL
jgi:stage II sporulation protein D